MNGIDKWIEKAIGFVILIVIVVPVLQLTLGTFTEVGGIIDVAGTEFEIAVWRFWPILVLVLALVIIFKNIGGKRPGEEG